ncbi:MAG: T9SS type A sorting domain-containing protein [Candidatus Firestonebacteria bacterium]|nr:T9SS type A sorting domain-containing protein [Candidatus Firestonebacteria bacterium]
MRTYRVFPFQTFYARKGLIPFPANSNIKFSLPERSFVELKVYNILGTEISTIVNKELPVGNYTYTFNAENLSSGVYYCKLQTESYIQSIKMILLK